VIVLVACYCGIASDWLRDSSFAEFQNCYRSFIFIIRSVLLLLLVFGYVLLHAIVSFGQALEVQAWGQHQKVASVADLNSLQVSAFEIEINTQRLFGRGGGHF